MSKIVNFYVEGMRGYRDAYSHKSGHYIKSETYDGYYEYTIENDEIARELVKEHYNAEKGKPTKEVFDMVEKMIESEIIDVDFIDDDWYIEKFQKSAEREAWDG